jgi:hypothetical protein
MPLPESVASRLPAGAEVADESTIPEPEAAADAALPEAKVTEQVLPETLGELNFAEVKDAPLSMGEFGSTDVPNDETPAEETPAAAPAEAPAETPAETPATPAEEPVVPATPETPAVPEAPKEVTPAAVPAEILSLFPDAKEVKDVVDQVATLKADFDEYKKSNDEVFDILVKNPLSKKVLILVKSGVPEYEAMRQVFTSKKDGGAEEVALETAPDPVANPEAYRKWTAEQIERQEKVKQEEKQFAEREGNIKAAREEAYKQANDFQKANNLTDDNMVKFTSWIRTMLFGDPVTFKVPQNSLEVLYKSYTYDQKIEAATIDGRNEAIVALTTKKPIGSKLPTLTSQSGKKTVVDNLTELESSLTTQKTIFE